MNTFQNINDAILNIDDLYTKKINKSLFVILIVVGVCMLYASTKMSGVEILGVLLFCIAFGMIVMGLVGLSQPTEAIYCKRTNEIMVKHVIYFDAVNKNVVRNAIKTGNKEVLKLLSNGRNNNMRAIVYATPSYSYSVFQIQTFVPHEYVPVEEPVIYSTCRAN